MSDIQEEMKKQYKKAKENDNINLQYMSTEEALNQIKQRIMMHELDDTTSNENEREKVILNYINNLQNRIDKATNYINKNWGHWCSNHCKYATETINILQGKEK